MQILVDDKPVTIQMDKDATLQEALVLVQSDHCAAERIVVAVRSGGDDIPADELTQALARPVGEFDQLEVLSNTKEGLVIDVMTQAANTLQESEFECQRVAEWLTQGKTVQARQSLAQCLRAWQQMHDAVTKSIGMLALDIESVMIRDETMVAAIGRPRDALLQIRDALVANDDVLLADILQYEFADVTDTWHAIIARLRREAEERLENHAQTT